MSTLLTTSLASTLTRDRTSTGVAGRNSRQSHVTSPNAAMQASHQSLTSSYYRQIEESKADREKRKSQQRLLE